MARKRYNPFKGKTSQELSNISPSKLSRFSERKLHALVTKLSSAANKRIRNMEKQGLTSPALLDAKRGGMFSGKGKSGSKLKEEYYRLQRFFRDESSTVKGAKKFMKEVKHKVRDTFYRPKRYEEEYDSASDYVDDYDLPFYDDYEKAFWKLYSRYYERVRDRNLSTKIKPSDFAAVVGEAMRNQHTWYEAETFLEEWVNRMALGEEERFRDYDTGNPNIIR